MSKSTILTQFPPRFVKLYRKLNTPGKIQDYINSLPFNFEQSGETIKSPLQTLRQHNAHCLEGALLGASLLGFHGQEPLLLDLRAKRPDDDHVVAVFTQGKYYGAISKTNHAVLRFREPIYKNARELALSYFHEYFDNSTGRKNLLDYSAFLSLVKFAVRDWETTTEDLWAITKWLDHAPHTTLVPKGLTLRPAEQIERQAGSVVEWKRASRH